MLAEVLTASESRGSPALAAYLLRGLAISLLPAVTLSFTELTFCLAAEAPLASAVDNLGLLLALLLALGAIAWPLGLAQGLAAYALSRWRARRGYAPRATGRRMRILRLSLGGLGLAGSLAAYLLNASAYVRLYHDLHRLLSIAIFIGLDLSFVLLAWSAPQRPARRASWGLLAALPALSAGAILGLHLLLSRAEALKAYAFDRTTVLAHTLGLYARLADLDGDHYSALFAGGDCDEGDSRRSPAALEIVGNGIDENCTGADLTQVEVDAAGRELAPDLGGLPPTRPRRPWNVLLVSIDALRWDRVFSSEDLPPGLRRAAERGVSFTTAYSAAPWTNASIYSLFTSRYPSQIRWTPIAISTDNRILIDRRPYSAIRGLAEQKKRTPAPIFDRSTTFAEQLTRAGYATATFPSYLFFFRNVGVTRGFALVDTGPFHERSRRGGGWRSDLMIGRARAFMEETRRARRPFFVWLHLMEPHEPYLGGTYDFSVRQADAQVARLLGWLVETGLDKETLVVLTSDHGEEFRDHGGEYHGTTLYEEVSRVPLVVLGPGTKARRLKEPVSHVDLAPTLLDLLGLERPPGLIGRSLAPWIEGRDGPLPDRPVLSEAFRFESEKRSLREGPYKLIHDRQHNTTELYNLDQDPRERVNLVDAEPERARKMREHLRRLTEVLELDAAQGHSDEPTGADEPAGAQAATP
jgi:hypothetical protein